MAARTSRAAAQEEPAASEAAAPDDPTFVRDSEADDPAGQDVIRPTNFIEGSEPAGHGERELERETDAAWWCPFDDHSNMQGVVRCGGCGAERVGETVRR
jgi:hypothetical protein